MHMVSGCDDFTSYQARSQEGESSTGPPRGTSSEKGRAGYNPSICMAWHAEVPCWAEQHVLERKMISPNVSAGHDGFCGGEDAGREEHYTEHQQ